MRLKVARKHCSYSQCKHLPIETYVIYFTSSCTWNKILDLDLKKEKKYVLYELSTAIGKVNEIYTRDVNAAILKLKKYRISNEYHKFI